MFWAQETRPAEGRIDQLEFGKLDQCSRIRFHLPNFPFFLGQPVRNAGGGASLDRAVLEHGGFRLILDPDLRPESAYFTEHDGERHGVIIFDMRESSQLPGIAEPRFLAFNASLTVRPAMNLQDLTEGLPGMQAAVRVYGKSSA